MPDAHGTPNNNDRAEWAREALAGYMKRTGSDIDTAVRDLIGDLGHLFDRDVVPELDTPHDFKQEVEWAFGVYTAECFEEAIDLPVASIESPVFELIVKE